MEMKKREYYYIRGGNDTVKSKESHGTAYLPKGKKTTTTKKNLNRKQDSRKKKRENFTFFFESFSFVCQMACVSPIKLSIYYKTRIFELRWLVRERVSTAALRKYWKYYVLYKWVFFDCVMRNRFNDDNNQNWKFLKIKNIYILKNGSWTLSTIICNRMNLFLFIMYIRDSNKVRGHNWIVPRTIPSRTKFYPCRQWTRPQMERNDAAHIHNKKEEVNLSFLYAPSDVCVCFIPFGFDSPRRQIWLKSLFCTNAERESVLFSLFLSSSY